MRAYATVPEPPMWFVVHNGIPSFFLPFLFFLSRHDHLPTLGRLGPSYFFFLMGERLGESEGWRRGRSGKETARETECVPLCFGSVSSARYLDYIPYKHGTAPRWPRSYQIVSTCRAACI